MQPIRATCRYAPTSACGDFLTSLLCGRDCLSRERQEQYYVSGHISRGARAAAAHECPFIERLVAVQATRVTDREICELCAASRDPQPARAAGARRAAQGTGRRA